MSDLLLVSLGTTHGLRVADSLLVATLREAGASVDPIGVRIGATNCLRRGYPVNDLVEAIAARRAVTAALARRPGTRAVIFSTTTTALLARDHGLPYAVRLDSPAAVNRRGPHNAVVRSLERRSLARARRVIALGEAGAAALPPASAAAEVLPVPVEPSGEIAGPRDPELAVAYVPDPKTKGLALLCSAWAMSTTGARRLDVFGVTLQVAAAFLAKRGLAVPERITFRGMASGAEFRTQLRRAHCFIHAASWEDFGQAPLEALADGALLVTASSDGPYEALAIARRLDRDLVGIDQDASSLAAAIYAAFRLTAEERADYQRRAAAALTPYSRQATVATLRERVLPALLDD